MTWCFKIMDMPLSRVLIIIIIISKVQDSRYTNKYQKLITRKSPKNFKTWIKALIIFRVSQITCWSFEKINNYLLSEEEMKCNIYGEEQKKKVQHVKNNISVCRRDSG